MRATITITVAPCLGIHSLNNKGLEKPTRTLSYSLEESPNCSFLRRFLELASNYNFSGIRNAFKKNKKTRDLDSLTVRTTKVNINFTSFLLQPSLRFPGALSRTFVQRLSRVIFRDMGSQGGGRVEASSAALKVTIMPQEGPRVFQDATLFDEKNHSKNYLI